MVRTGTLLWAVAPLLGACSDAPRQKTRTQPTPVPVVAPAATAHIPAAAPLVAPRVYQDPARVTALEKALAQRFDPHTALALGRLQHLAGNGRAAALSFARARRVLYKAGASFRPEVVTPGGLVEFAWQGTTLAVARRLNPATRSYRGGWTWIELWDRIGGRYLAPRLRWGPAGGGTALAWSRGQRLVLHGGHRLLWLKTDTGRLTQTRATGASAAPRLSGFARRLSVARISGHLAATTGPQTVRLWDAKGRRVREVVLKGSTSQMIRANMGSHCEMRTMKIPVRVSRLALSPRARWLAVAGNDGKVRLVNVRTGRTRTLRQKWRRMVYAYPRNPFDRSRPLRLWFSNKGRRLKLLQANSSLFEWDTRGGRLRRHFQVACKAKAKRRGKRRPGMISPRTRKRWARESCVNVHAADLNTGAKLLATARGTVRLWRLPSGASAGKLPLKRVQGLSIGPKGSAVAVSQYYHGGAVWKLSPPRSLGSLDRVRVRGQLVDLTPDGRYLAIWEGEYSYSKLRRVVVWDLARRKRLGQLTVWGLQAVRFTSDGRALVAGVAGGVEQWQLSPFKRVRRFAGPRLARSTGRLATAGDQLVVWGYADKRWRIWNKRTGAVRAFGPSGRVNRMVLSSDGRRLALITRKQVALWDVTAGHLLRTVAERGVHGVAWSRRGRWLALASRTVRGVRVMDVTKGTVRAHLKGVRRTPLALVFGPRDRQLFVGGIGVFGRWDWRTGTRFVPLKKKNRHLSPRHLKVSADGRRLIVFGFDHRAVSVWDPSTGALLADLWPVEGTHWVATSHAGATDASSGGREALVTLVPPRGVTPSKRGRPRREAVYGWELGWACFEMPGLIPAAVMGRSVTPEKRPGCRLAP